MPAVSEASSAPAVTGRAVPAAAVWLSFALCVVGLATSIYLSYAHLTEPSVLSCPDTGVVNCTKVTTSSQSMLLGLIPVAFAGLAYFVGMTVLCLPPLWRSRSPFVRWLRLAGVVGGMLMVFYLVYVELVELKAICLYCTAVHIVTFLLFVVVLVAEALTPTRGRQAG